MELLLFEQTWMDVWDGSEPREPVGAIFTKPEIIELILDLAGYRPNAERLATTRLLEPSCGDGTFLVAAIRRLLASERFHQKTINWLDVELERAVTACDLNSGFISIARHQTTDLLIEEGCPAQRALVLAEKWIIHADFLLARWPNRFDFVVGNPPYVRIEDLPPNVLSRYRELYRTSTDRADLYVAFFENGLRLLSTRGSLAFICANRFAKNHYGRSLRQFIADQFHVHYYLNLEHTQPFISDVSAYPCITVIDRQRGQPTLTATLHNITPATLQAISPAANSNKSKSPLATFSSWYSDGTPWIATERAGFDRLTALAKSCPTLEESANDTVVGIGVATGADSVYVVPQLQPDIEPRCQLPLLMAADICPAEITWSGHYLINPFCNADDGSLRNLQTYPGLAAYFHLHRAQIQKRHVARKRPDSWYRTIDRVTLSLTQRPKLVIPDIQSGGVVGYDAGDYYPHHNVYWITSAGWNLRALQALLRSQIVLEQIRAHSVQMRGGSIRYQAQVLRKVRVPTANRLPSDLLRRLAAIATSENQTEIDALAVEAFASQ
jgi:hypothetical protein